MTVRSFGFGHESLQAKKMKSVQVASAIALLAAGAHAVPQTSPGTSATPLYKDPKAKVEDRVADLLSRMTIEEKAAQLVQGEGKLLGVLRPSASPHPADA